jgi:hypothetical protein
MKDYRMPNISQEEDRKSYSGKYSSGKKNQLLRKALFISFIKLNNSFKRRLMKMLYKKRKCPQE